MRNHQNKNLFQIILDVVEYKVIIDPDDKMAGQMLIDSDDKMSEKNKIPDLKWSSKLL